MTVTPAPRAERRAIAIVAWCAAVIGLTSSVLWDAAHATTGEILRHLTLDPTKNYQPTGQPPGPRPRKPPQPEPQ